MSSRFANYLSILLLSLSVSMSSAFFVVKRQEITPVILVPGDGGSQVEAKLHKDRVVHYLCEKTTQDFFNIWLNMELLVPLVIDCWIDNMRLVYDNVTRMSSNSKGVEIRIPGFGNTTSVEWLDPSEASPGAYFKDIANALVALGYERNVSLRGAPYDFRKAPNGNGEYFVRLKALVEETYGINDNQRVIILAHSMGGPMSLHFLHSQSKSWKDKYIRALVTLSGAWGGSVKALKVFAVGDNLGSYVLRESILREEQITSPSLAWLMPSSLFWNPDEILIQTDEKNYTTKDFKEFFEAIDYPVGWEMRKDVEKYSVEFQAPDVEVHCLHGFGVDTINRLVYKPGTFPDGYPGFLYGDGDGTVNKRSLEGCLNWKQKEKVYHQTFSSLDHTGILHDERVLSYLQSIVTNM
ncbi:group XV phospholipase A2-like isoform X1 [Zootermopsis nevadensis]|uniref:group XV phospholipase A2-like isoform X1 n=2 Tax=Zootermopsis nevadensis TaxID=136037 RepID=UPI000B8EBE64|nr:group XV phospholipase A2-like isoform X1 [Zootermopsis nevadensis]